MTLVQPPRTRNMVSKHLSTQEFNLAVYQIVVAIPPRKLVTCGQIAKSIGFPSQARRVREAVNFISYTSPPVPWHRVVATSGVISVHGSNDQQHLLEAEGVETTVGVVGESRVTVEKWSWYPETNDVFLIPKFEVEDGQDWGA